ncbi:MAG: hypothetical protein MJ093_02720 [Saccharofermentans sp.]|nr:hypothetical protein [Saccharofermentans sp.]
MVNIICGIIGLILVFAAVVFVGISFKAKTRSKSVLFSVLSWVLYIVSIFLIIECFSTKEISVDAYNQYRNIQSISSFVSIIGYFGTIITIVLGIVLGKTKAKIPVRMLIVFFLFVTFSGFLYNLESYIGLSRISESEENTVTYTRTELVVIEKDTEYYISDFVDINNSSDYFISTVYWSNDSDKYADIDLDVDNNSFHVNEDRGILTICIAIRRPITPGTIPVTCNVEVE